MPPGNHNGKTCGRYRKDFDKGVKAYGHKQSSDHKGSQQGTNLRNRNNYMKMFVAAFFITAPN